MRVIRGFGWRVLALTFGLALALGVGSANGSDPVIRPAADRPSPAEEAPSEFSPIEAVTTPPVVAEVPPAPPSAPAPASKPRAGFLRDESLMQASMRMQLPDVPPTPRPRMPAAPPAAELPPVTPPPAAPTPAPPPNASASKPKPAASKPAENPPASPQLIDTSVGLAGDAGGPQPWSEGFNGIPVMIGDLAPSSRLGMFGTGQPSALAVSGSGHAAALIPWARGFKIADNQSPQPQDRLFFSFNYFDDLNGSVNRRLGAPVGGVQAFRELFGFEKTFWDGLASFGMVLPLNSILANHAAPGFRGSDTALGDLTAFTKFILWRDNSTGSLLSGGLAVTMPTGPSSFAGASEYPGLRDVRLQPFLGLLRRRGDFYFQGFSAIDVPTSQRDVLMWYNDLGVGYFLLRNTHPDAFLTAVVPTFEAHVNDPLTHRGSIRPGDPFGTADVVDLTLGANFILRRRSVLSLGVVDPVTGPKPFAVEAVLLYSLYFGRSRSGPVLPYPPVL